MLVKTAELIGSSLDWAVAQCEGKHKGYAHQLTWDARYIVPYSPSTDWSQGGPIIEREGICLRRGHSGWWIAYTLDYADDYTVKEQHVEICSSALVAAMRCYVLSNLGDNVDVPEELL